MRCLATALALISLLLCACNTAHPAPAPMATPATVPPPAATATPGVAGIAFPRQATVEGERASMTAAIVGMLVERDGCLWIESLDGSERTLPIWPPEFTLRRDDGELVVVDGQGFRVPVGTEVRTGGGHVASVDEAILQQVPPMCRGAYFIVGEGFAPNLVPDSPLFRLEVLSPSAHPGLAIYYRPTFLLQLDASQEISGTLVHYASQRCIQLQTDTGPGPTTLLWPEDWQVEIVGGRISIANAVGESVAQESDLLRVSGRPVPASWESEIYRRAVRELPFDCCCTFFLVENVR